MGDTTIAIPDDKGTTPLLEGDMKADDDLLMKDEQLRELTVDKYDDEKYTFDFCLVFKIGKEGNTVKFKTKKGVEKELPEGRFFARKTAKIIESLNDAGLRTHCYKGINQEEREVYCLIGATERRLCIEAERIQFDLRFHKDRALDYALRNNVRLAVRAKDQSEETKKCKEAHWNRIFGRYSTTAPQEIYERYNECGPVRPDSLFKTADRLKLTDSIVKADYGDGGAGLALGPELYGGNNPMCAYFPLHTPGKRKKLTAKWVPKGWKVKQPLDEIVDYFGEKIGFYFSYLGFYCDWLLPLMIVGIIFFIAQIATGEIAIPALTIMAVLTIVWSCLFIEFWKQYQSRNRTRWGMTRFERVEPNRPQFQGKRIASMIDGKLVEYYGPMARLKKQIFSHSVILTLILVIVAAVTGFFFVQNLNQVQDSAFLSTLVSILNGVQIQVFNQIYSYVAVKMNNYENHQTQSDYENSLISKLFAFKFINSYNSLFYIAFVQRYVGDGCDPDIETNTECLPLLRQQLGTVFATIIFVTNATELGIPWATKWWEKRKDAKLDKDLVALKTPAEKQREFVVYENMDDYDQLIVQFGYVVLFIVAFPLTPVLALAENRFQIWLDSHRVMFLSQRPIPSGAFDIGTWQTVLDILIYITIGTNLGLIVFYSPEIDRLLGGETPVVEATVRVFVFVIAEHLLILMKIIVGASVADEGWKVKEANARTKYIVRALVDGKKDDPDADFYANEFHHDVSNVKPMNYDDLGMGLDKEDPRGLH